MKDKKPKDTPLLHLNDDFIKGLIKEELLKITDVTINSIITNYISTLDFKEKIGELAKPIVEKRAYALTPSRFDLKEMIQKAVDEKIMVETIAFEKIKEIADEKMEEFSRVIDMTIQEHFLEIEKEITKSVQQLIRGRWFKK